ncbi:MAG: O-methyltransferase [Flavobacteriaceae bacterium]|nr:O-methyltransferase [Flavobacteriaceae bacterium]
MNFLPEKIDNYAVKHSEKEPKLLEELSKETWQKVLNPRMLSGHFQGRILSILSKIKQPENILEIGTYTGYSALCLAEGLVKKGFLHTIDCNEELKGFSKKYFDKSDYKNQIIQHTGDALKIIPTINTAFDLVFIDADKPNYSNYFHAVINKMNKGGIILSDNVLWSGKVTEKLQINDENTKELIIYNKLLHDDIRVQTVLLPIRDGLTVSLVL